MKAKSFAVLGLGRFGRSVAETLYSMGYDVLAIDKSEECINLMSPKITHAVVGDATDEVLLKSLGIRNFDVAIVAIGGETQPSILATLILKEAGVKHILAKAQSELHSRVLYKVGADRVVFPEKDMGARVAHNLVATNILDQLELSPEYSIVEIIPPEIWIGKSLKESNIRVKYGINIMAIKHNSSIVVAPKADYIIKNDDIIVALGANTDINKLGDLK
jgi:trk system potassium uptake protein TrkA